MPETRGLGQCPHLGVLALAVFRLLAGGGMDSSVPSARIEADGGQLLVTSQVLTGAVLVHGLPDAIC